MILTIIGVLVVLWALGLLANIGGGFIHLLLVIALIALIYDLVVSRPHRV